MDKCASIRQFMADAGLDLEKAKERLRKQYQSSVKPIKDDLYQVDYELEQLEIRKKEDESRLAALQDQAVRSDRSGAGIFQKIYRFFHLRDSMTAMRECVAGFYQYTYWAELGIMCLGSFWQSLFFGTRCFENQVIRLNELFIEKLEDTKLM